MGKKKTPAEEEKAEEKPKVEDAEDEEEDGPVVKELKAIDDRCLEVEKRFRREVETLRKKFAEEQAPILMERKEALAKVAEGATAKPEDGTPALPGFWFQAMSNHPAFEDMIEEWDDPVLQHMTDITRSYLDDGDPMKGFSLNFHFAKNPYFEHDVLSKTYKTVEGSPWTTGIEATEITVTEIEWNPGFDVTVEVVKKKPAKGGAKRKAGKSKEEQPRDSFFRSFFRALKLGEPIPQDLKVTDDSEDEEEDDATMELILENEYDMACAIRDQLIPFAVRFYTGEACPQQELDDFDEDDDDDDDDEDDDDDDDEDDEPPPTKGKKPQAGGKKKGPVAQEQECKQQ